MLAGAGEGSGSRLGGGLQQRRGSSGRRIQTGALSAFPGCSCQGTLQAEPQRGDEVVELVQESNEGFKYGFHRGSECARPWACFETGEHPTPFVREPEYYVT